MRASGSPSVRLRQLGHQPAAASAIASNRAATCPRSHCLNTKRLCLYQCNPLPSGYRVKAASREASLAEQQETDVVPLLLPALGSGRIARSEQLQQRGLAQRQTQGSIRRATVNVVKLLTNQIAAATSLEQLHDILAKHGKFLDHIHVAKLLSRTSQLSIVAQPQQHQHTGAISTPQPQQQQVHQQLCLQEQQQHHLQQLLVTQLTAMMVQRLRHATGQSLVAAVAALGRMSSLRHSGSSSSSSSSGSSLIGPSREQLQALADKAVALAPVLDISQLAVLLWGLAKAGYCPGSSSSSSSRKGSAKQGSSSSNMLEPMLAAVLQQYNKAHNRQQKQLQQQQQQELEQQSTKATDDPQLQKPKLPFNKRPCQQQQQQGVALDPLYHPPHQHSLATDLSLVLYALAVMGLQPSADWLDQWQAAVLQQATAASAQDIAQMLWSLSSLGVTPAAAWLHNVLAATTPLLASAGGHALSSIAWAVARSTCGQQVPQAWVEELVAAVCQDPSLASNPHAFSSLLASLARLKARLEPSKLGSMLQQSIAFLPTYTPWQLTNIIWACTSFSAKPTADWTKHFMQATAKLADAGKFTAHQLASVLWSLAVLHRSGDGLRASQQLQVQVMLNALAAANNGSGLQQLGAAGRNGLAWAIATLGMAPSRPWLAQYLSAAFDGGLESDQVRCAHVLFCMASVDFEFLVEWLGNFLAGEGSGAATGGLDLSLEKYASLAAVLTALSEMDSKQLRAAWLDISSTEWSPEAAAVGEGYMPSSLQLPPALSTWVDQMLLAPAAASQQSTQTQQ